jgi:Flp pilus assembly protein TadG
MRILRKILARYAADQKGAAAAEFALIVTLLTVPILNVMDVALYAWDKMQVDNAAQSGAQAVRATCTYSYQPATYNCPNLNNMVQTAVRSTPLGSSVNFTIQEHYYCTVSGSLVKVWDPPSNPPADCSQKNMNGNNIGGTVGEKPGDYVQITTTYTYAPIFPAVSVASALATTITRTAWMRL